MPRAPSLYFGGGGARPAPAATGRFGKHGTAPSKHPASQLTVHPRLVVQHWSLVIGHSRPLPLPSPLRPALLLLALLPLGTPSPGSASAPAASVPTPAPSAPRLASLSLDAALSLARAHLAESSEPAEQDREIVGLQFIPPHGRGGTGFWLVDLAPYPADRPSPAAPFSSLLIGMDGRVEERGGRRPLDQATQRARDQKAAGLHQLMREASSPATPTAP